MLEVQVEEVCNRNLEKESGGLEREPPAAEEIWGSGYRASSGQHSAVFANFFTKTNAFIFGCTFNGAMQNISGGAH